VRTDRINRQWTHVVICVATRGITWDHSGRPSLKSD
jgi:hypothetical protein